MSVAIVLEIPLSNGARLIPIASDEAYAKHWLPVAEQLGLRWLPLFISGANVALEELPEVTEELRAAEQSFAAKGDLQSQQRAHHAQAALMEVFSNATTQSVFIG